MSREEVTDATELVPVPEPSFLPLFFALSLATLFVGLFFGLFVAAVGFVLTVLTIKAWVRLAASDLERQPRHQRTSTAVIPAEPLRRS